MVIGDIYKGSEGIEYILAQTHTNTVQLISLYTGVGQTLPIRVKDVNDLTISEQKDIVRGRDYVLISTYKERELLNSQGE